MSNDGDTGRALGTSTVLFLLILIVIGSDLMQDWASGVSPLHVMGELVVLLAAAAGVGSLWVRSRRLRRETAALGVHLREATADAERWRAEAEALLRGLGEAVSGQFDRWLLTPAEQEVALMLIKGLSHKEVAQVRGTSEPDRAPAGARDIQEGRGERSGGIVGVLPGGSPPSDPAARAAGVRRALKDTHAGTNGCCAAASPHSVEPCAVGDLARGCRESVDLVYAVVAPVSRGSPWAGLVPMSRAAFRLEAATICQLACPSCATTHGTSRRRSAPGSSSSTTFAGSYDENPWVWEIELSNWGDIFLNPDIERIIAYAYRRSVALMDGLQRRQPEPRQGRRPGGHGAVQVPGHHLLDRRRVAGHLRGVPARGQLDRVLGNIRRLNDHKKRWKSRIRCCAGR